MKYFVKPIACCLLLHKVTAGQSCGRLSSCLASDPHVNLTDVRGTSVGAEDCGVAPAVVDERLLNRSGEVEKPSIDTFVFVSQSSQIERDVLGQQLLVEVSRGNFDNVFSLLRRGAYVDFRDEWNATALMHASRLGNLAVIQALLNKGADVNSFDQFGQTALMQAANYGNIQVVQALIDAHSDVNYSDSYGGTALIFATAEGHSQIAQALIDGEADVNRRDYDERTALMYAAERGYTEIVHALLDGHPDVLLRNKDGHTAIDIARQTNHHGVAQILRIHRIMKLLDNDVASACREMITIEDMIYEAITSAYHSPLPALEIWSRAKGPRLLEIALNSTTPCGPEFVKAALTLATNIRPASDMPVEFARASGLAQFCDESGDAIRELIAGEKPWESFRANRQPDERASVMNAYAVDLPMYCPNVLVTAELKEVVVQQYVLRLRLRTDLIDRPAIHVNRTIVFTDSIEYFNAPIDSLLAGLPCVGFLGEEGIDRGGVGRDWYDSVTRAVFESGTSDPAGGLFTLKEDTDYLVIDTDKPFNEITRPRYIATGRLLAFSLVNRLPNGATLPRFFWAALMNNMVGVDDIRIDDPIVYKNIQDVLHGGPDYIRVSLRDHTSTVDDLVAAVIASVYPIGAEERMGAIREGFNAFIPIDYLKRNFKPTDIHAFVFGDPEISVDDLKANTDFLGEYTHGSDPVVLFWQWLSGQDNQVRRNFLQFVTGLSQVPLGGFSGLGKRMIIAPASGMLPRSHTCFFMLELPNYTSVEQLNFWMLYALAPNGFGLA